MYCGDDVGAIVADIGSLYAKFGYAGDDQPKWVEPSHVGVTDGPDGDVYHLGTNELIGRAHVNSSHVCSSD